MTRHRRITLGVLGLLFLHAVPVQETLAARVSKVQDTKHNLSATGPGVTHAASGGESQICVFCHTPHGAETSAPAPLWNKTLVSKTYTVYSSKSLDAETIRGTSLEQPMGSSKLCLSCHDGAMALGSVRVLRRQQDSTIAVQNTGAGGVMPDGSGKTTGFTRNLGGATGLDLTNDHPVSVTYDKTLSDRDGEMRPPDSNQNSLITIGASHPLVGKRVSGQTSLNRPVLPLEATGSSGSGQVQCITCHDPHIKETDLSNEANIKFLRRNRFQLTQPTPSYSDSGDILCLACHDKGMQGAGDATWVYSTHANSNVATQQYRSGAGSPARIRDFPDNIPVWKVACLNCHDTHTVTGSRRLLREGTDSTPGTALASGGFKDAGNAALEETCYQCHRDAAGSILANSTTVPNIRDDFAKLYHMPIASGDQDAGSEKHDVGGNFNDGYLGGMVNGLATTGADCSGGVSRCGADLLESQALLGRTASNRHAECSDCHNPHRVVKFKLFYGNNGSLAGVPDSAGTHTHTDTAMTHSNVASGVLRGIWGVEPSYPNNSFHSSPNNFVVRRGDPGNEVVSNLMPLSNATMDSKGFVTREYQVCLKCHSNYAFTTAMPLRSGAGRRGLTGTGTNGLTQYTDQAKEFQAPDAHADEPLSLGSDGGAGAAYNTNNHRSWHPVMRSTGRTLAKRGITGNAPWYRPWSNAAGTQTMYCSDCHGSGTTGTGALHNGSAAPAGSGTVIPNGGEDGSPWGPHGSDNPFILKGQWSKDTGGASGANLLCFKCHDQAVYTSRNDSGRRSGFYDGTRGKGNLHNYHVDRMGELQCTWCHVAVPHGWKNKALLVNLNDVGEEAAQGAGSSKEVRISANGDYYTQEPYYLEAKLKIRTFSASGSWDYNNCGSSNKTGGNLIASTNGNNSSNRTDNNVNWMKAACSSPP